MVNFRKVLLISFISLSFSYASKYEFVGNFQVGELLSNFCLIEKCNIISTPHISTLTLPFVIQTDSKKQALNKIKKTLINNNIFLLVQSNDFILKEKKEIDTKSFLDYENNVQTVPSHQFNLYIKRDSLLLLEKQKNDSILQEKISNQKINKISFENYNLTYLSFSQSFLKLMGLEWGQEFATGSLHKLPELIENFKIIASETNDSTFIYRKVSFALDTSIFIDWGNEEQVIKRVFNDAGVITQEYEEKKHGLSIKIKKDSLITSLSYSIRSNDEKNSVLTGSSSQENNSILKVDGFYTIYKQKNVGVPFLCHIPFIGSLFSSNSIVHDVQYFLLILEKQ